MTKSSTSGSRSRMRDSSPLRISLSSCASLISVTPCPSLPLPEKPNACKMISRALKPLPLSTPHFFLPAIFAVSKSASPILGFWCKHQNRTRPPQGFVPFFTPPQNLTFRVSASQTGFTGISRSKRQKAKRAGNG